MRKPAEAFDDPAFLARLRLGDEAAYRALVRRFHASLTRVASAIIGSQAQAEEVVQDAWLAVFAGIGRFEGRSSLATWVFTIVLNRARTRIGRESRTVALPAILDGGTGQAGGGDQRTRDQRRAVPLTAFKADGHWVEIPSLWEEIDPERVFGGRQLWDHALTVIEVLPASQKAVITLRDLEGQDAATTCALLGISAENQRVLLHRARGRVRQSLDLLLRVPPAPKETTVSNEATIPMAAPSPGRGTGRPFLIVLDLAYAIAAGVVPRIQRRAMAISSAR